MIVAIYYADDTLFYLDETRLDYREEYEEVIAYARKDILLYPENEGMYTMVNNYHLQR